MFIHFSKPMIYSNKDKSVLGLAIVLAMLAHALLLTSIKLRPNLKISSPAALEVQLAPLPEKSIKKIPIEQPVSKSYLTDKMPHLSPIQENKAIPKINNQSQENTISLDTKKVNSQPTENSKTINTLVAKSPTLPINYGSLMESAKQIAKEEARNITPQKDDAVLFSDRPFSPELAQILEKKTKVAGVTNYADGMNKVVTPSGTEYCIQSSQIMAKGAFDNAPIAMTCP